jgi:hypothetical protein
MASPNHTELARTQALCWLLDELLDAKEDLLALVALPEALSGWRRERLGEFCQLFHMALAKRIFPRRNRSSKRDFRDTPECF